MPSASCALLPGAVPTRVQDSLSVQGVVQGVRQGVRQGVVQVWLAEPSSAGG